MRAMCSLKRTPPAFEFRQPAYSLQDANRALMDMKQSKSDGTPVLLIDAN